MDIIKEETMKKIRFAAVFASAMSLAFLLRADDTVLLNDGSVLKGQIMEETTDHVVLMDHGIQRTLQRSLVAKISFNTDPSAVSSSAGPDDGGGTVPEASSGYVPLSDEGGNTVPAAPTQEQQDYATGVSNYYQIPPDQVWGFEQQGVPYEELPVVFYVARRAQCAPGEVVSMRLSGMSWSDICMHFALGPGIFYWRGVSAVNLGGPYSGIYFRFGRYQRQSWDWNVLALSDADIINCVNLRFSTAYWQQTPFQVAQWRGMGHPYFWGGYGRGRSGIRLGGQWGHGGQNDRRGQNGQWGQGHARGQWGHGQQSGQWGKGHSRSQGSGTARSAQSGRQRVNQSGGGGHQSGNQSGNGGGGNQGLVGGHN